MSLEDPLLVDLGTTMPKAKAGWALIAIGKGAPKRIADYRLSISERMFGGYTFVEVDVGDKLVEKNGKLPTPVPGLYFNVEVRVQYRVTDPVQAVNRGTRTVWALLRSTVWPTLEFASQVGEPEPSNVVSNAMPIAQAGRDKLVLSDLGKAQQRINRACAEVQTSNQLFDRGIDLLAVSATLSLDSEAEKLAAAIGISGLKIGAQQAEDDVNVDARKRIEVLFSGGPRPLFAEAMRNNPHMILNLLEQLSSVERERYASDIAVMRELFSQGHLEGHHLPANVRDEFLRSVLNRAPPGDILMLGVAAKVTLSAVENKSGQS